MVDQGGAQLTAHERKGGHKDALAAHARRKFPEKAKSLPPTTSSKFLEWRAKMSRVSQNMHCTYMEVAYNNSKGVTRPFGTSR